MAIKQNVYKTKADIKLCASAFSVVTSHILLRLLKVIF
jgi:hypothetical protein